MPRPRKTRDIWEIHGDYGYGQGLERVTAEGFECVTAEASRSEAKGRLREYRDNEPGVAFKMVKVRERIERP